MHFTEPFIRRPVLAISLALVLFFFGLRSLGMLPITEYPPTDSSMLTVTTHYFGATPKTVNAFITAPLEKAVGQAPGINYMTGVSEDGVSIITLYMRMGENPNAALSQVQSKVNTVLNQLPKGVMQPIVQEMSGSGAYLMMLTYHGKGFNQQQITDYLTRVVQPAIESVPGIGLTSILPPGTGPNGNTFAMRVWLNPHEMSVLGITPSQVSAALKKNDFVAAVGRLRGEYTAVSLSANTALHTPAEFRNLVVATVHGVPIHLSQVAKVSLGAQTYDSSVMVDGRAAVNIGIEQAPGSNALQVAGGVEKVMARLKSTMPPGVQGSVIYNGAQFVKSSLQEVEGTIGLALLAVILVIYLFMGSWRALIVPALAIPVAMVGAMTIIHALGYTLNLLTLLAMVLAIGLVVDDAIIVVENVHRHIEHGATPLHAALQSAKELASPILVMATTLVAVFAPMAFIGGLVGHLFSEFAFTIVATVLLSMIAALTLAPMLASRVLKAGQEGRVAHLVDHVFGRLKAFYGRLLFASLKIWPVTVTLALVLTGGIYFLFSISQSELAPPANQGLVYVNGVAPPTATLEYMNTYDRYLTKTVFDKIQSRGHSFAVNGVGIGGMLLNNEVMAGVVLNPKRGDVTTQEVRNKVQTLSEQVPGMKLSAFGLPPLPGAAVGLPVQFVLTSAGGSSYQQLDALSAKLVQEAKASGLFSFVSKNLDYNDQIQKIVINRQMVASFGLSMADIGQNLETLLGGNYVNYFDMKGLSYRVVPQVPPALRANPNFLKAYTIKTPAGTEVPLSTFVSLKPESAPTYLPQFQQLPAVFIQANPAPGVSLGQALQFLQVHAKKILPSGDQVRYAGESRQYEHQGDTLLVTFGFALLMVFLLLATQFNSFRDSLVVLTAVPVALFGALLPISLGASSVNIYSEVGMVMLIGLIAKQGILIVQFARVMQEEKHLDKLHAVIEAGTLRLRPILMTVAAMIAGAMPLLFASGGNADARFSMGLVIVSGLGFGSMVSLFVVPAFYLWFGRSVHTQKEENTLNG
ncbi:MULTISPECIES: efflux RND transporter permease subunit [Acidithiobacillus]|uniref:efflux RND transporter permease subunit n=1 Tax=Acidithiobacillus TaxID=119977 RepID=UPI00094AB442|nr:MULTISPECIES: efflux RND transporter permease subunit [Acidithiobacillus]MBE7563674.1 efflux RND transporter permease subunit [Acidithiobacillus sp. HP-6]MBE7569447.1 efflux RND transporter permease subunit [Acidithiobacillus sp. HP-2]